MKILGICGSPRKESQSGTYRLIETVLENTGMDYDLVSLRKKTFPDASLALDVSRTTSAG